MKLSRAKKQTIFLTGINALVRALGLTMRIWLSRVTGAEIMGIMELAQSVHMAAIAPLTSGLPVAISRLTAKANGDAREHILASGLWLVKRTSFILIPALWFLSPVIARCLGDNRVMPSLWFTAPCILILGYSAVYNGYSYGLEKSELPALSELVEQLLRFFLTFMLISRLPFLTAPWLAAVPVFATMVAEIAGLFLVLQKLGAHHGNEFSRTYVQTVFQLSAPATLSRMIHTFFRSITSIMIPARLQASGMAPAEATAQLGMLNGMVAPVLIIPGIFTSALSMVLIPKIAKAEEKPSELGRLLKLSLSSSLPVSVLCAGAVYLLSSFLANQIFRHPETASLFRMSAWQIILFPIIQLSANALSALGQQRLSFYVSLASACATLGLTWYGAGQASLRLNGVICAQYASQVLSILMSWGALIHWNHRKTKSDDRFS